MSTGDEIRSEPSRAELATSASSPEVADLRAQLAELGEQLLNESLAHDECHQEYDSLVACAEDTVTQLTEALARVKALEARCAQLEAEQKAAVRLVGELATRAGAMEARCEAREAALLKCQALAEIGNCGSIASIIDALLGEVSP